jgi:hypothetical protein
MRVSGRYVERFRVIFPQILASRERVSVFLIFHINRSCFKSAAALVARGFQSEMWKDSGWPDMWKDSGLGQLGHHLRAKRTPNLLSPSIRLQAPYLKAYSSICGQIQGEHRRGLTSPNVDRFRVSGAGVKSGAFW